MASGAAPSPERCKKGTGNKISTASCLLRGAGATLHGAAGAGGVQPGEEAALRPAAAYEAVTNALLTNLLRSAVLP